MKRRYAGILLVALVVAGAARPIVAASAWFNVWGILPSRPTNKVIVTIRYVVKDCKRRVATKNMLDEEISILQRYLDAYGTNVILRNSDDVLFRENWLQLQYKFNWELEYMSIYVSDFECTVPLYFYDAYRIATKQGDIRRENFIGFVFSWIESRAIYSLATTGILKLHDLTICKAILHTIFAGLNLRPGCHSWLCVMNSKAKYVNRYRYNMNLCYVCKRTWDRAIPYRW